LGIRLWARSVAETTTNKSSTNHPQGLAHGAPSGPKETNLPTTNSKAGTTFASSQFTWNPQKQKPMPTSSRFFGTAAHSGGPPVKACARFSGARCYAATEGAGM